MKFHGVRMIGRPRQAWAVGLCAGLAWMGLASIALAHQVWLEDDGSGTKLYFGEFGDNLHEVSPGFLDKIARPTATLVSARGDKSLEVKRMRDGIAFVGRAKSGESVLALDTAYPLMESKDGDKTVRTAWTPAARYLPELRAQQPKLTLDIVPTNGDGQFQVTFRGAPLKGVDVSLVAASGWSLAGKTDDQGKVSFRLPWKGTYALLVRHKDPTPGTRKGVQGTEEAYDGASFGTTLTFVTSTGLPSPPAPPPAPPNVMKKEPAAK